MGVNPVDHNVVTIKGPVHFIPQIPNSKSCVANAAQLPQQFEGFDMEWVCPCPCPCPLEVRECNYEYQHNLKGVLLCSDGHSPSVVLPLTPDPCSTGELEITGPDNFKDLIQQQDTHAVPQCPIGQEKGSTMMQKTGLEQVLGQYHQDMVGSLEIPGLDSRHMEQGQQLHEGQQQHHLYLSNFMQVHILGNLLTTIYQRLVN